MADSEGGTPELRRLAMKAYHTTRKDGWSWDDVCDYGDGTAVAPFVAACSPERILALLDALEATERELIEARELYEANHG